VNQVKKKEGRITAPTMQMKPIKRGGEIEPEFKYIQYLPKHMDASNNVSIDKAIRSLYAPPQKDVY